MGKDLMLYVGAFCVCTGVLLIPGIVFLLYWAVTRNDDKDQTQYVEHHHHYQDNKTLNINAPNGTTTFKHTRDSNKFMGYLS